MASKTIRLSGDALATTQKIAEEISKSNNGTKVYDIAVIEAAINMLKNERLLSKKLNNEISLTFNNTTITALNYDNLKEQLTKKLSTE
jgi:putative aminopeptidase FrvX